MTPHSPPGDSRPPTVVTLSRAAAALVMAAALAACAPTPPRHPAQEPIDRELAAAATAAPGVPPLPPAVREALLPPLEVAPPAVQDAPRFDIQVNDAPAREFFMALVEDTEHNMLVHPELEGRVSLSLKDVTVEEVLAVTRDLYGYRYRRVPIGYMVLPARLETRIFEVNYLDLQRTGNSQTRVSSGQVSERVGATGGGDDTVATVVEEPGNRSIAGSDVRTVSETDFWLTMGESLAAIVGDAEGHQFVVYPQAGIVLVRAMPEKLDQVAEFLRAVQDSVERQVVIEAKIIEVILDDAYRAGIDWALFGEGSDQLFVAGQRGSASLPRETHGERIIDLVGQPGNVFQPLDPALGLASSTFGGIFSAALRSGDFALFLELLDSQGEVRVLSSPRIATVNNQKAVIKVGTDEFFVTDISTTTVTGTTTTTSPDVELTPFFSGIAMDVTPHIKGDGDIILHIHPSVSEVTDQSKQVTIGNVTQSLPLALSTVRESDSIVRVRSGEVVVIGGLMQGSERNDLAETPGLGDVPLVGGLFRNNQRASRKSELVILLRPILASSPAERGRLTRETAARLRQLNRSGPGTPETPSPDRAP